jgi:hypothetical protein
MGARKFLRYGVSLVMMGLGVGVIYYEYFCYSSARRGCCWAGC